MKKLIILNCMGISRDMIEKMQNKLAEIEYLPPNRSTLSGSSYMNFK